MPDQHRYTLGPDIDLDVDEVYEPDGTRLTEARAEELADQTLNTVRGLARRSRRFHPTRQLTPSREDVAFPR